MTEEKDAETKFRDFVEQLRQEGRNQILEPLRKRADALRTELEELNKLLAKYDVEPASSTTAKTRTETPASISAKKSKLAVASESKPCAVKPNTQVENIPGISKNAAAALRKAGYITANQIDMADEADMRERGLTTYQINAGWRALMKVGYPRKKQ